MEFEFFTLGVIVGFFLCVLMEKIAQGLGRCEAERTIRKWEKESLERITRSDNAYFGEPGLRVPPGTTHGEVNTWPLGTAPLPSKYPQEKKP